MDENFIKAASTSGTQMLQCVQVRAEVAALHRICYKHAGNQDKKRNNENNKEEKRRREMMKLNAA